ncbi:MAG TPA: ATP-binding protein [Thermoleophilia bacterium]|nr:ATP-binding protein [Thermoleophilia bacterium]
MARVPSVIDSLGDIIRAGEGQGVEFKRSLGQRDRALKALCGMLNANGGEALVIFGVEPDGAVAGVDSRSLDAAKRSLSRAIQINVRPALRPELEVARLDGRILLVLHATRPEGVALYECRGRAYIRLGSETLRMSHFEREALTRRRGRFGTGDAATTWRGFRGGP